jgi:DNA polymerase-3 subunit epsilon
MVKEHQPLYNIKLRRTRKLLLAKQVADDSGYCHVELEDAHQIEPDDLADTLAVYTFRGKAKSSLEGLQKLYELCPKLLGLEKSKSACFLYQLHKCRGACAGKETAEAYNQRVTLAFERQRIQDWPFSSPVLLQEKPKDGSLPTSGIVVDQWCVVAEVQQEAYCEPEVRRHRKSFDLDTYKILQSFLETKLDKLHVQPLSTQQLLQFGM